MVDERSQDDEARYWIERISNIRQYVARDASRAPHKPLLLLYLLGRFRRSGSTSVTFIEVEPVLRKLLVDFGPANPRPRPEFPFARLENDGLWMVRGPNGEPNPGDNAVKLRQGGYVGELSSELVQALTNSSDLVDTLANYLLYREFPESVHSLIAASVGLVFDSTILYDNYDSYEIVNRRKRPPGFRELVLDFFDGQCAFCGFYGRLDGQYVGVEAAHIQWFAYEGASDLSNGIALCALHHVLFDLGVMGIDEELAIDVSVRFDSESSAARLVVRELKGKPIERFRKASSRVSPVNIAWHRTQVFKRPRSK